MTVIVGIAHRGKVYLGGDRGMSDKEFIGSILTPKIHKVGPILMGYSASQGTGQLAHLISYTEPNPNNIEAWVRMELCDSLQKAAELFKVDINTEDNGADLLIGVAGRLFEVSTLDWSVSEYDMIATGSGFAYALGSLHSTRDWDSPRARVREALRASIRYSPSCQGPIDLLTL
jgi:20S proteasome alpha/beta subunit